MATPPPPEDPDPRASRLDPPDDAPRQNTPPTDAPREAPSPPDVLDEAAGGSPVLQALSHNRWQILAGFWVVLTVVTILTEGWSAGKVFYVLMAVLFTAAAMVELRVRLRRRTAPTAPTPPAPGPDADPDGPRRGPG